MWAEVEGEEHTLSMGQVWKGEKAQCLYKEVEASGSPTVWAFCKHTYTGTRICTVHSHLLSGTLSLA